MGEMIPEFHAQDSFTIKRPNETITVYTGKCPYDWRNRKDFVEGLPVMFNGQVRRIRMYESFATLRGPDIGVEVGLLFFDD